MQSSKISIVDEFKSINFKDKCLNELICAKGIPKQLEESGIWQGGGKDYFAYLRRQPVIGLYTFEIPSNGSEFKRQLNSIFYFFTQLGFLKIKKPKGMMQLITVATIKKPE
jgi:hypothetical protein